MNKNKLKLEGFNNLTKTLSFNIYDVCFARTRSDLKSYLEYIDEVYNADRLTCILKDVTRIINANVLNIAHQDYEPHGASVTMLIAEGDMPDGGLEDQAQTPGPLIPSDKQNIEPKLSSRSLVAHLDKSHITVHTYPEIHPTRGISTFRVDIDVSTCGHISPLKALNYLIHSFESDIVIMDYRVRGFTRDIDGTKHFIDHEIHSIQEFLSADTKARYQRLDVNVYDEQMFHTKMRLSEFDVEEYLFNVSAISLTQEERRAIEEEIQHEITEIYYGKNRVG